MTFHKVHPTSVTHRQCFGSKTAALRPGIVRQLSLMETDKEEASGSEMWEPNFAGTPSRKAGWDDYYL